MGAALRLPGDRCKGVASFFSQIEHKYSLILFCRVFKREKGIFSYGSGK